MIYNKYVKAIKMYIIDNNITPLNLKCALLSVFENAKGRQRRKLKNPLVEPKVVAEMR